MQRIVLTNGGERTTQDSGAAAERRVMLVFPTTHDEYRAARAEVEGAAPPPDEPGPRPADRGGDRCAATASDDRSGAAATLTDGRYVLTTREQRRAWGLPDLPNGATARGEPGAVEPLDPIPVADSAEAIDLLFEDDSSRSDPAAAVNEVGDEGGGGAAGAQPCGALRPAPFVNLKQNRGPVSDDLRTAFRELCGQAGINDLLRSIDVLIEPLERSALPDLEASQREVEALRRLVTRARLGAPDERAKRVATTCRVIRRRLQRFNESLGRLDFSKLKIQPKPSALLRTLREDNPAGNAHPKDALAMIDQALTGFERAADEAVGRIRAVVAARGAVEAGEWTLDALRRIRLVLQSLFHLRAILADDSVPNDQLEALRSALEEIEKERRVTDPLAALTQDVLQRFEAAELPASVLARALDEIRLSRTAGNETATIALERLRVVASLPWTARATERMDIGAAMRELEAAYAGRPEIKTRIRQFLATRRLTSTTWTIEGRSRAAAGPTAALAGGRPEVEARSRRFPFMRRSASTTRSAAGRGAGAPSCRRDGSAPLPIRRLVVRPAGRAVRAPILCFAGPPGCGKTALAKLIAGALRRPAVTVALGGVWDEAAIRGLPIAFRSPQAGRIVRGLLDAKVRNPVMILDEIDKVGGAKTNCGDPSAALLEVLDPEQNPHFRDVYLDVPLDLSEVLFIATANDVAGIPAPLRDRLEIIEASGYSDQEKVDIARRTLWADQLAVHGLNAGAFWAGTPTAAHRAPEAPAGAAPGRRPPAVEAAEGKRAAVMRPGEGRTAPPLPTAGAVEVTDAAIREVVRGYTCEAGVRELARRLGAVCRFVACPPGREERHRSGHHRRRRRRGRASRTCLPSPHRGRDPGTAAVRLATRPRA